MLVSPPNFCTDIIPRGKLTAKKLQTALSFTVVTYLNLSLPPPPHTVAVHNTSSCRIFETFTDVDMQVLVHSGILGSY